MQSKLTRAEKEWLDKLQQVLDQCPSDRLGFFTIGDPDITVFDKNKEKKIDKIMDQSGNRADFSPVCDDVGAILGTIVFPSGVYSTAG